MSEEGLAQLRTPVMGHVGPLGAGGEAETSTPLGLDLLFPRSLCWSFT